MNFFEKIKVTYNEGRLKSVIFQRLRPYLRGFILLFLLKRSVRKIKIHTPKKINPKIIADKSLIDRIFSSYSKMRVDQRQFYGDFSPSSAWQNFIDTEYSILHKSLENRSIEDFNFFLLNFGSWDKYQGIENTPLIKNNNTYFRKMFLKHDVFYKQLKMWRWITNNQYTIKDLCYPSHGNQVGAFIDNTFVGAGSFFNHYYAKIFTGIVSDRKRPVLADLGGGYGKLAFFTLKDLNYYCFLDFDIPEILTLAAYYLAKSFPEKKMLLYGEEKFDKNSINNYDLIFMPPWEIQSLEDDCIDLFLNKNSLGEMSRRSVDSYLKHITRSTRYFFHMNHEKYRNYFSNQETSYINQEFKIPKNMKMIMRYPDIGHLFYMGKIDYKMDIFFYLYEKVQ